MKFYEIIALKQFNKRSFIIIKINMHLYNIVKIKFNLIFFIFFYKY